MKTKLFLDLDDTVFDTENYIKSKLGGKWVNYDGLIYTATENMSYKEKCIVKYMLTNYEDTPMMYRAKESIEILKEKFDIILCTSCSYENEKYAKYKIANKLGLPIILCSGDNWDKSKVDMSNGVFVENNTRILNKSNASRKICFYQRNNYVEELVYGDVVYNWYELLNILIGG